jgi:hypothetical protein
MNDNRIEPVLTATQTMPSILDTFSDRERELLKQNKRLRELVVAVADRLRPGWRNHGFGFESSWMLEDIDSLDRDRVNLERGMGNLLEVIAHYERKINDAP